MSVAVAIDLLAAPGSLARPEEAGQLVAPRPIRSIRDRIDVFRRHRELLGLIRRHGFGPLLAAGGRAERAAEPAGVRLRRVLDEAGGVFVKIGQIAATRIDLLSPEICGELSELQNRVPAEPPEQMEAVLDAELHGPVDAVFAEFDWEPLAAASGSRRPDRCRPGLCTRAPVLTPDEMAEAFAATRGVAGPTQLRAMMKSDQSTTCRSAVAPTAGRVTSRSSWPSRCRRPPCSRASPRCRRVGTG